MYLDVANGPYRTPWVQPDEDATPDWVLAMPLEEPPVRVIAPDGFRPGPRPIHVLSGNEVSEKGWAAHWCLHESLLTVKRLMIVTQLSAYGPTTTMDLCALCGISHKKIGPVLRGLEYVSLIDCTLIPGRLHGVGLRRGHPAREWHITDCGRQAFWRVAWVTRDVLHKPWEDVPLRKDVESDPLEAIRRHIVFFWLRPCGLQVARIVMSPGWAPLALNQVCRIGRLNPGLVRPVMERMKARGWIIPHPTDFAYDGGGLKYPKWQMSSSGLEALGRHVDALRRAGRTTNWVLDPDDAGYNLLNEDGEFRICWEESAARCGWRL